jgi:preprotein translocase subunit SecD
LNLAIVPNVGDSGQPPHLTQEAYQSYVDDLAKNGPSPSLSWANSFHWVPTQEDAETTEGLPCHVFGERTYMLLCARETYVLQSVVENELKWKLEDIQVVKDDSGAPAIRIQFDETASRLLHQLTQTNISNHLAICTGDEIQYISVIKSPAENELLLSGDFTGPQASELAERFRSEGALDGPMASDPRMGMYMQSMGR